MSIITTLDHLRPTRIHTHAPQTNTIIRFGHQDPPSTRAKLERIDSTRSVGHDGMYMPIGRNQPADPIEQTGSEHRTLGVPLDGADGFAGCIDR